MSVISADTCQHSNQTEPRATDDDPRDSRVLMRKRALLATFGAHAGWGATGARPVYAHRVVRCSCAGVGGRHGHRSVFLVRAGQAGQCAVQARAMKLHPLGSTGSAVPQVGLN